MVRQRPKGRKIGKLSKRQLKNIRGPREENMIFVDRNDNIRARPLPQNNKRKKKPRKTKKNKRK